jgi:hypothetical protein
MGYVSSLQFIFYKNVLCKLPQFMPQGMLLSLYSLPYKIHREAKPKKCKQGGIISRQIKLI